MYEHKFWQMDKTQLFELFNSSEKGLSPKEIIDKREFYGLNEISKGKTKNGLKILISQFKNPLVILLIIASIIALLLGETITGLVIIIIVLINGFLGFFQEYKSERTIEKLKKYVVIRSRVVRDGKEQIINSNELVPGDLIHLKFGDVIPADIRIVESSDLTIDESSLTGEFFPVEKDIDLIQAEIPSIHDLKNMSFMGTHIREGEALGIIVTTGKNTYFGKTAQLLKEIKRESEFQKKMKDLSFYLVKLVLATIIIIFFINMLISKDFVKILLFSLALAVGMVPEALSIIITISLSNGAVKLAKKDVIVKRLISVEDLGNIDIICTDKTGTLTENRLTLEEFFDLNGKKNEDLLTYSLICNSVRDLNEEIKNPLDYAIWKYVDEKKLQINQLKEIEIQKILPFDSYRKRMSVIIKENSKTFLITKGAPEILLNLSSNVRINNKTEEIVDQEKILKKYVEFASRGYRVIGIAIKEIETKDHYDLEDESNLTFLGYLAFMDPPKPSASEAIIRCRDLGINIKVLTGDGPYVTKEIVNQIGLNVTDEQIITGFELEDMSESELHTKIDTSVVFCRVTPDQKYKIVKALRGYKRVVAFIGDGINDAPALKEADVGIAVDQGSDIAKDVADIVLLSKGLEIIVQGILEGRRIFGNIVKYLIYTIAGNFGDLYTVGGASMFMTFLPLESSQLILANFLTDTPMIAVSTDTVESDTLVRPRRWNLNYIFKFSALLGVVSALYDAILIIVMIFGYNAPQSIFQTALFLEVILSEIFVLFMIRSDKVFYKSTLPSKSLIISSIIAIIGTFLIIYTPINQIFGMTYLPIDILFIVILIIVGYVITTEIVKLAFYHKIIRPKFGLIFVNIAQNRLFNKIHQKFRTSRFVNKESSFKIIEE